MVNAYNLDERESKYVHVSFNASKVKDAKNETRNEEPSHVDNSVINAPRYLKPFECGENFLNRIDSTCELACIEI